MHHEQEILDEDGTVSLGFQGEMIGHNPPDIVAVM